jgi:hypothetical protein
MHNNLYYNIIFLGAPLNPSPHVRRPPRLIRHSYSIPLRVREPVLPPEPLASFPTPTRSNSLRRRPPMSQRGLPGHPPQRPDAPSPAFPPQISLPRISSLPHAAAATFTCLVPNPTQSVAVVRSLARRSMSTTDPRGGDSDIVSPAPPPPNHPTSLDPRGCPATRI